MDHTTQFLFLKSFKVFKIIEFWDTLLRKRDNKNNISLQDGKQTDQEKVLTKNQQGKRFPS